MPTRWNTFSVEIDGGLVQSQPPIQQGVNMPGSATTLTNFEPSIRGGYRRINGYTKWDSDVVPAVDTANKILGVGILNNEVLAVREGSVYTSTGSGWTEIAAGRTQTTKVRYSQINLNGTKKLIGTDGVNYPYSWDGTTFTILNGSTDVEGAKFAVEFKDHIFYATGNIVTFTAPFDENNFSVADGAGDFRMPNDVTGIYVFRERLFVFTRDEIMVLDGDSVSDWRLTSVSDDVGCIEADTIQEVGGDVAFLAADGVRLLGATDRDGDFSNGLTNKMIQSEFLTFRQNYDMFSSCIVRSKSQYRIFGYNAGQPDGDAEGYIGVQFNPQDHESFQWSETKGLSVFAADSKIVNGTEVIVFSNEQDYVYQMEDGFTFDGVPILASYFTPYFSFDDPRMRKTLYKLSMYFSPEGDVVGSVSLNFDQDNINKIQPPSIPFSASGGGSNWGEVNWDNFTFQDPPDSQITKQTVGSGFNVSLQFSFTEEQECFIFDTIFLEYDIEDRK